MIPLDQVSIYKTLLHPKFTTSLADVNRHITFCERKARTFRTAN